MIVLPRRPLLYTPGAQLRLGGSLLSQLVGYWAANEGGGLGVADARGVTPGVYIGTTPAWEQSPYGPALKLDGSTNYLSIPDGGAASPIHVNLENITWSLWLYWKAATEAYNTLVEKANGSGGASWLLKSDGTLAFFNSGTGLNPISADVVPFNKWTHLAVSWDSDLNVVSYINGVKVASVPMGNSGSAPSFLTLTAGASLVFGSGRFINGSIRDFGFWSRALSPAEVQELYLLPGAVFAPRKRIWSATGAPAGLNITGSVGIPSNLAMGCSAGAVNLGTNQSITGCGNGIPSNLVVGTLGGLAIAPNLTGTAGIPSNLAMGVGGSVLPNPGITGNYGIPSNLAMGHGALLIRDFAVFLANVDITDLLVAVSFGSGAPQGQTGSTVLTITDPLTGPSTASCTLRDPTGVLHPQVGTEFLFYRKGKRLFGGTVEEAIESAFQADKATIINLKLNDFSTIFDRRVIGKYYDLSSGGILEIIVADVIQNFLQGDGISYNPVDGDPGTVLGPVTFNWVTVRTAFSQLAAMTGWDFHIDPYKTLRWFPHATGLEVAPFSIQDNDGNWLAESLSVRTYRGKYRNREFVLSNTQSIALWCDTFSSAIPGPFPSSKQAPDGIRQEFITLYGMNATPQVLRNSNSSYDIVIPLSSVSAYNAANKAWDWYWLPPAGGFTGGNGVFQNTAHAPLGPTEKLQVCYPSQLPPVSYAQDNAQIAARAAIEGNSGIYDSVDQAKDITDPVAIQAYAQGLLTRFGSNGIPREVIFSTYREGLKVGQLIRINTSQPLVPDAFYLISNLVTTDVDKSLLLYQVTATTGANPADWTAFFSAINRAAAQPVPSNRETHTWQIAPSYAGITNPGLQNGIQQQPYAIQNASVLLLSWTVIFRSAPTQDVSIDILINSSGTGTHVYPAGTNGPMTFFFASPTRVFAGDVLYVLAGTGFSSNPSVHDGSVTVVGAVSL